MPINFLKNSNDRYEISELTAFDKGVEKDGKFFKGLNGYKGGLWCIVGWVLELFKKAVAIQTTDGTLYVNCRSAEKYYKRVSDLNKDLALSNLGVETPIDWHNSNWVESLFSKCLNAHKKIKENHNQKIEENNVNPERGTPLLVNNGPVNPPINNPQIEKVKQLIQQGLLREARTEVKLLTTNEVQYALFCEIADAYVEQDQIEDAIRVITIDADTLDNAYFSKMARRVFEKGNIVKAYKLIKDYISTHDKKLELVDEFTKALLLGRKKELVLEVLTQHVPAYMKGELLVDCIRAFAEAGEPQKALDILNGNEFLLNSNKAKEAIARAFFKQNEAEKAFEILDKNDLKLDFENMRGNLYLEFSKVFLEQGNVDEAAEVLEKLREKRYGFTLEKIANLLYKYGPFFGDKKALRTDLALEYFKIGKTDLALELIENVPKFSIQDLNNPMHFSCDIERFKKRYKEQPIGLMIHDAVYAADYEECKKRIGNLAKAFLVKDELDLAFQVIEENFQGFELRDMRNRLYRQFYEFFKQDQQFDKALKAIKKVKAEETINEKIEIARGFVNINDLPMALDILLEIPLAEREDLYKEFADLYCRKGDYEEAVELWGKLQNNSGYEQFKAAVELLFADNELEKRLMLVDLGCKFWLTAGVGAHNYKVRCYGNAGIGYINQGELEDAAKVLTQIWYESELAVFGLFTIAQRYWERGDLDKAHQFAFYGFKTKNLEDHLNKRELIVLPNELKNLYLGMIKEYKNKNENVQAATLIKDIMIKDVIGDERKSLVEHYLEDNQLDNAIEALERAPIPLQ